jgi:hypothetical protein
VPFSPRVIAHISARSVHKRQATDIAPAVRRMCDDLLERFAAVAANDGGTSKK